MKPSDAPRTVLPKPALHLLYVFLPYLTHLIPLINSLVETARTKLGVLDKGDIEKMQARSPPGQVWEALP